MTSALVRSLPWLALLGAGCLALNAMRASRRAAGEAKARPYIRPAGREAMDIPPRKWDIVDEQSDESFPASDPPGNY